MPLYEYECDACGRRFELIQRFSDRPAESCSLCGSGPVRKLLSSPAIQFKGSGWYITDYAKKDQKTGGGKGDQKDATGSADKSDTAKDKPAKEAKEKSGGEGDKSAAREKSAPAASKEQ
jgi:putative FmdB family regulatory protein